MESGRRSCPRAFTVNPISQLKELRRGRRIFTAARAGPPPFNIMTKHRHQITFNQSPAPRLAINEPEGKPSASTLSAAAIAAYAFHIWEQEGRPVGRDREHWLQAEAQLRWALLADDLTRPASQTRVRRKLWDQSTARFGPGRPASRKPRPAALHAR